MDSVERGIRKRKRLKDSGMPTTNHLLVIGINSYGNGIPTLNNAVKDAKAFEALLIKKYDFKKENIISLYDNDATKDNIFDAFDKIITNLTSNDNLIFFFSGHGELNKTTNRGYWIPIEARPNRRGSYLNTSEIRDFVAACKARHVLGIVDACYSGSLLRNISNELLTRYYTKPSRKIMTSGLIEPVPDGMKDHHSPFAASLLSVLTYNTKPYLSTTSLWSQMQEGLVANSESTPQFEAMHGVNHQGGDFFFLATEFDDIPEEESVKKENDEILTRNMNAEKLAIKPEKKKDLTNLSFEEWKVELKRIATTNLMQALTKSEERIDTSSEAFNSILLLQSRCNSATKDKNNGLVTDQQSNISFNRIKAGFSGFLDNLDEYDLK